MHERTQRKTIQLP